MVTRGLTPICEECVECVRRECVARSLRATISGLVESQGSNVAALGHRHPFGFARDFAERGLDGRWFAW